MLFCRPNTFFKQNARLTKQFKRFSFYSPTSRLAKQPLTGASKKAISILLRCFCFTEFCQTSRTTVFSRFHPTLKLAWQCFFLQSREVIDQGCIITNMKWTQPRNEDPQKSRAGRNVCSRRLHLELKKNNVNSKAFCLFCLFIFQTKLTCSFSMFCQEKMFWV